MGWFMQGVKVLGKYPGLEKKVKSPESKRVVQAWAKLSKVSVECEGAKDWEAVIDDIFVELASTRVQGMPTLESRPVGTLN